MPVAGIAAIAVIDTNVWLDLFVFLDARAEPLRRALDTGFVQAVRCAPTDAELDAVLRRPRFALLQERAQAGLEHWRRLARELAPGASVARSPWVCRDPDDQKFLELAYAARASLLLTKDKALLALNRRAAREGLAILSPSDFGRRIADDGQAQCQGVVQSVMAS
jgi:putative PIN family toxin of toxin-antitoxin system